MGLLLNLPQCHKVHHTNDPSGICLNLFDCYRELLPITLCHYKASVCETSNEYFDFDRSAMMDGSYCEIYGYLDNNGRVLSF